MPYLKHESGGAGELRNSQILGDRSPLEFDMDGYVFVEDPDVAKKLLAMHRHIERGGHRPETSSDEADQFDAAVFVGRTPMDDVIADIESGDYDDHLEALEDEASRDGVLEAIAERRE